MTCSSLLFTTRIATGASERKALGSLVVRWNESRKEAAFTGILVGANGIFLGLLEGKAEQLQNLVAKLGAEKEWRDTELLRCRPEAGPQCGEWTVNVAEIRERAAATLQRLDILRNALAGDAHLSSLDAIGAFAAP